MKKLIVPFVALLPWCAFAQIQSAPASIDASEQIVQISLPKFNANFSLLGGRIIYGSGAPSAQCTGATDVGRIYFRLDGGAHFASQYNCENIGTNLYGWSGPVGGAIITSVFGRIGAVTAQTGDYTASQITNAVDLTGSYANPTWITSLAWGKLTGVPSLVNSFNGRNGTLLPASGDYTCAQVTNCVDSTSTYSNPSWLTGLAFSKISGVPSFLLDPGANGIPKRTALGTTAIAVGADLPSGYPYANLSGAPSALPPSGAAGGDLSGSYPNPGVGHVNGVSYPSLPSTNTVPVVTAPGVVTYESVPNGALANPSVTINGATVALGSSQTITAAPSGSATGDLGGSYPSPTVTGTHLSAPLPIAQGGTGSASPGLIGGANVSITGAWPNQTVSTTVGGAANSVQYSASGTFGGILNATATNKFLCQVNGLAPGFCTILSSDLPTITLGGDLSGNTGSATVRGINGVAFSGLATGLVKNTTGTGAPSIAVAGADYAPPTSGSAILKGNGSGGFSSAVAKTDYAPATSGSALLKGDGAGGFASAVAKTDYAPATSGSSLLKGDGLGGFSNAASGTDYAPPTSGSALLKGNGTGGFANAASGTDYAPATSGSALLKGNGAGGFANAVAGTDYLSSLPGTVVQTNQSNAYTAGTQDFTAAAHVVAKNGTAASKPATCAVGEVYFATDATPGQNWYFCTAVNTWTQQLNSGTSGGVTTTGSPSTGQMAKFSGASTITNAVAGTDYAAPPSGASILKGNGSGGFASATPGTDYAPPTSGSSILKGNSLGGFAGAVAGTDYAAPTTGTSLLKANGSGGFANATGADIPNIGESQVTNLTTDLAAKVPATRNVNTAAPLTGGGALSADLTLNINNFGGDSGSGGSKGSVPAPAAGDAAAGKFLSASGAWAVPSGSGGLIAPVTVNFNTSAGTCTTTGGTGTNSCTASTGSVVVTHNLGTLAPLVSTYISSSGSPPNISVSSNNQLTITFVGDQTGIARIF